MAWECTRYTQQPTVVSYDASGGGGGGEGTSRGVNPKSIRDAWRSRLTRHIVLSRSSMEEYGKRLDVFRLMSGQDTFFKLTWIN